MASRIRDWILTNWPIKLTALVLSAILWAATAAQEPTTQVVPVRLEIRPPEGREFTQPIPQVQALYAGAARELFKLYGQPPIIQRSIPDTVMETFTLDLAPADLIATDDADVNAQDITPRTITVYLDKYAQRRVAVVPRVTVLPDSGFAQFGDVRASPNTVGIRGPDALVRQISSVPTLPVELPGVTTPVQHTVAIDTSGLRGISLLRREVEISVDVGPVMERVLMGVPVIIRSDEGVTWEIDPPGVTVTVSGPSDRVARLGLDSVVVVALIAAHADSVDQPADSVAQLEVTAPPGITARASPDSVIVRRTGRD